MICHLDMLEVFQTQIDLIAKFRMFRPICANGNEKPANFPWIQYIAKRNALVQWTSELSQETYIICRL